MKSNLDSLSYAFGVFYYGALSADSIDLDPMLIAKAMFDGKDKKSEMTEEEARTVGTEDIREGSAGEFWNIGDVKDLLGIGHMASNSDCFVVRS